MPSADISAASHKAILLQIETLEGFCTGDVFLSPQDFRTMNEALSLNTVLMIGKRRYSTEQYGAHLIWEGLDKREHDLGPMNEANITRDYPGFHKIRTHALTSGQKIIDSQGKIKGRRGTYTQVTLENGGEGIGPNYSIALRNAVLKNHLKTTFNQTTLADVLRRFFGFT